MRYTLAWPRVRAAFASCWSFARTLYRVASGREALHLMDSATCRTLLVIDWRRG